MNIDDDIGCYKKRSKYQAVPRSKHTHDYQDCVYEYESIVRFDKVHGFINGENRCLGTYCSICGKIGKTSTTEKWYHRQHDRETDWHIRIDYTEDALRELDVKTRTLPTFFLNDYFRQKFVDLEVQNVESNT